MIINDHSSNNKRIAKNTIFLYLRMLFLMFLGFYSSRVTLEVLGQENYGIYNLVAGVIVMFQFLNASLTSAMQRYLNFALGENNLDAVKKIFSICMRIYIILSIILLILCETIGLAILNFYLNIPDDRIFASNIVFHISSITMIVNMLRIPFNSAIIASEKMSFFAYVSIIEGILKLLILYVLQIESIDKLILYSILVLLVSIIVLIIFFIYSKKRITFINFNKYKDGNLVKSLLSYSGWNVFGSFASLAVNQGINIFINRFFGVLLNAAMAAANQANNAISSFLTNFQTAFHPQLVKSFAKKDMNYVYNFAYRTSKYSFFLMYFIILPFSINLNFVLSLWLSDVPNMTSEFINIMLLISLTDAISDPFWMLAMAEGNIKKYQIIGSISSLLILPISYVLLYFGFSAYWTLIIKFLQGIVFLFYRLLYLKKRIKLPLKYFFTTVLIRVFLIISISYPLVALVYKLSSSIGPIPQFFISCSFSCIILILLYWIIGIDKEERQIFVKFLKVKLLKKE